MVNFQFKINVCLCLVDSVPEPQAVPCATSEIEMQEGFEAHPQTEAENVVELPAPARSSTRKRKVNCLQGASDEPALSFCENVRQGPLCAPHSHRGAVQYNHAVRLLMTTEILHRINLVQLQNSNY